MELNKKNMRKIMILITFTILLLVGLMNVGVVMNTVGWSLGILMPFIIGGGIAFLLSVPMRLFEEKIFRKGKTDNKVLNKIRRPMSILLSLLMIIGIILFVIFLVSPEISKTVVKLTETIPEFFENAEEWFMNLGVKYPQIQKYIDNYTFDLDRISTYVIDMTQTIGSDVLASTFSILGSIVSTITNFVIGLVFAIYLLSKKEKLAQQGKKILYSYLPMKRADRIIVILKLTHKSFSNFISGQCVEAVIEGCMFFMVLSIFNFDYALLIGILVGFTALIPIFGAFIGCVIGTLLLFMVSPAQALWFVIIFLILQQIESNLIYPYVVGGSIGLPSIWVLFAVTLGGSMMGVVGMLIFIPLFSVFYVIMRENVKTRLLLRRVPEDKYNEPHQMTIEQQRNELEQRGKNRTKKENNKETRQQGAKQQEERQQEERQLSTKQQDVRKQNRNQHDIRHLNTKQREMEQQGIKKQEERYQEEKHQEEKKYDIKQQEVKQKHPKVTEANIAESKGKENKQMSNREKKNEPSYKRQTFEKITQDEL